MFSEKGFFLSQRAKICQILKKNYYNHFYRKYKVLINGKLFLEGIEEIVFMPKLRKKSVCVFFVKFMSINNLIRAFILHIIININRLYIFYDDNFFYIIVRY